MKHALRRSYALLFRLCHIYQIPVSTLSQAFAEISFIMFTILNKIFNFRFYFRVEHYEKRSKINVLRMPPELLFLKMCCCFGLVGCFVILSFFFIQMFSVRMTNIPTTYRCLFACVWWSNTSGTQILFVIFFFCFVHSTLRVRVGVTRVS